LKDNARALVIKHVLVISLCAMTVTLASSCQKRQDAAAKQTPAPQKQSEPAPTVNQTAAKTYRSVGVVTKVVLENPYGNPPSVELDHEEIEGLMPPMIMEFYVKEKSLLAGIKVGDRVEFTIEEKGGTEVISAINKQ
jgi:Cu(I)/Ag(I) efflux system protein CusF